MKRKRSSQSEMSDKEEDDMFSAAFKIVDPSSDAKILTDLNEDSGLSENHDDAEGYLRINIGDMLNHNYKVTAILGRGVFASVVKAVNVVSDEEVAIKILRNNEVMYKAGQKELATLLKLQKLDPNGRHYIVSFLNSFEHRKHLCLIFESMAMDLREVVLRFGKTRGLNIRAIRAFGRQLFSSLCLLRRAGILHSDIKPDNILINKANNVVKLADFGSAGDVGDNDITPYLVSRYYRPPEVVLGLKYEYGMDVWSVACTLYELYTGKILFPGRSNNHMIKLMMEAKGRFPLKMLRKCRFLSDHFVMGDSESQLLFIDKHWKNESSSSENVRTYPPDMNPKSDIKSRLLSTSERAFIGSSADKVETLRLVGEFVELLSRCLSLNPERRISCFEALEHPFLKFETKLK